MSRRKIEMNDLSFDLSISDLMSSLLMIFILLLITSLLGLHKNFEKTDKIVEEYRSGKESIYDALRKEFEKDLVIWGAEIDPETLSIRFKEPDILFEANRAELRIRFKEILTDFFPRYTKVLYPKYNEMIEEIRIEGHTAHDTKVSYLSHMDLSQERTNQVLRYIISEDYIKLDKDQREWVESMIAASGFAYSRPIKINDKVDPQQSRRVEFRIRTNSEQKIDQIIEASRVIK